MLHLRKLIVISAIILTTFSSFIVPTKTKASAQSASASVLSEFSNSSFQQTYTDAQKNLYNNEINILRTILQDKASELQRGNPSYFAVGEDHAENEKAYKIQALNDFKTHLNNAISEQTNTALKKALNDTLSLADSLHTKITVDSLTQDTLNAQGGGTTVANAEQTQNAANEELQGVREDGSVKKEECKITNWKVSVCVSELVEWFIKNVILEIAAVIFYFAANMLNYSIQIGILQFKDWAPDTLYPIWVIVRQIISLFVVFIGLWLGFMYILGKADTFEKYIPWVIIFALFINFSYPLSRTAIDISNIISLNVYAATVGPEVLTNPESFTGSAGGILLQKLGLSTLVTEANKSQSLGSSNPSAGLGAITGIPGTIMVVVFILYAAYVMFKATFILAIRTGALVFLTIASPFLFIDSLLPVLGDKAQKIRTIFFEQLAVGPVFMILFALSLKFITLFSGEGGPIKTTFGSGGSTPQVFFSVLMMLIMLHITLKVTKDLSGAVGEGVSNMIGKVGGFATGAAVGVASGGAGLLARGTIGRAAGKLRDSSWVTNNQNSAVGRRVYDMSNSLAKGSYDLRNSSVVAGGFKKAGITLGAGTKGGYEERAQMVADDLRTRASRIKTHYERDEFKKDKDGNIMYDEKGLPVYANRKGDVNKEGMEAYNTFVNNPGKNLELTGAQKEKFKQELAEKKTEKDMAHYNSLPDEEKDAKYQEMKTHFEELKKTDPKLKNPETLSLVQTLGTIEKGFSDEKKKFNKEVDTLSARYAGTTGKDDADILANRVRLINGIDDIKKKQALIDKVANDAVTEYNKLQDSDPQKRTEKRANFMNALPTIIATEVNKKLGEKEQPLAYDFRNQVATTLDKQKESGPTSPITRGATSGGYDFTQQTAKILQNQTNSGDSQPLATKEIMTEEEIATRRKEKLAQATTFAQEEMNTQTQAHEMAGDILARVRANSRRKKHNP
ncbi:MAG: hypothetical protein RLZZ308_95 [Candidatus Parcubacteria bacterium]|jgi:hypothetical protein